MGFCGLWQHYWWEQAKAISQESTCIDCILAESPAQQACDEDVESLTHVLLSCCAHNPAGEKLEKEASEGSLEKILILKHLWALAMKACNGHQATDKT